MLPPPLQPNGPNLVAHGHARSVPHASARRDDLARSQSGRNRASAPDRSLPGKPLGRRPLASHPPLQAFIVHNWSAFAPTCLTHGVLPQKTAHQPACLPSFAPTCLTQGYCPRTPPLPANHVANSTPSANPGAIYFPGGACSVRPGSPGMRKGTMPGRIVSPARTPSALTR